MVKKTRATKKCGTCGKTAVKDGHLCVPVKAKDATCDWCGSLIVDERHMCNDKLKEVSYICNSCGRMAVSPEYLCKPKKIG